jgi:hypothetical protein
MAQIKSQIYNFFLPHPHPKLRTSKNILGGAKITLKNQNERPYRSE